MRSGASSSTTSSAERRRPAPWLRGLARYFVVGGVAACVDIGLFLVFAKALGLPYLPVSVVSFLLATLVNYLLSIRFVFVSGKRFRRHWETALVFAVSAAGLAVNTAILWFCVERLHAPLLASKVAATGIVFLWNYLARRFFVFGAVRA